MKKSGTLITEYTTLPKFNGVEMIKGAGETVVAFQWQQLSKTQYLIVIPKLFKKASGDTFAIVSPKKFLNLLSDAKNNNL